jgi:hypothetical protein
MTKEKSPEPDRVKSLAAESTNMELRLINPVTGVVRSVSEITISREVWEGHRED